MRKAVWGENLKHGFVEGLGWNALAYPTFINPAQEQDLKRNTLVLKKDR